MRIAAAIDLGEIKDSRACESLVKARREGGFTLVELLIVVLILSILGMAIMPQMQSMTAQTKLEGATGELVSALGYAADLAATYQRPFGVKAVAGSTAFSVFDARYKTDPAAHNTATPPVTTFGVVLNPVDKQWYALDFQALPHYAGAWVSAATPSGEVWFYPAGHCSVLSNSFVVSFGSDTRVISLNGITGRVTVQ